MKTFDRIISGGIVVDGLRNPRYRADIGIRDGRITAIGRLDAADADEVLDAAGHIVAPGFVDLHTHYDAQLFWDPYCTISSMHGVTTVVIGNCGFGFAPVDAGMRDWAMRALCRNEQIPFEAMQLALPWSWETFPEFLDVVETIPKGVNVLPYLPASPLLIYAMGMEAAYNRHATPAENAAIARILDEALTAGACGWSAQRLPPETHYSAQRDHETRAFPSDIMSDATAAALVEVMARRNEGFVQMALITADPLADRRHLEELARSGGRPILWNALMADGTNPDGIRDQLAWFDRCREQGLPLYAQGFTTDPSMVFSLDIWNMWDAHAPWRACLVGTVPERMAKLADPAMREALRQDKPVLYPLDDVVLRRTALTEYQKYEGRPLPEIADALGLDTVDAMVDLSLAERLGTVWQVPLTRIDEDLQRELVAHPYVLPGVSDGGAHTKMITSGSYPTEHLATYVRDRGWVSLEEMHWKLSALPAFVAGVKDRGTVQLGAPADLVVYDLEGLRLLPDEIVRDLPGGEWRRIRRAEGYRYILVNGEVTLQDGAFRDATPGRLLRHGRADGPADR
ncbi:amidohydrolase family protein [Kitasatospora sp. NPDC088134]|uniref:N-acyl-D-amino-acid deacylase family protein n=1 Tax=Kitasatospora sp. NPDC088134 TaxID=3364071 RepID=UPI003806024F